MSEDFLVVWRASEGAAVQTFGNPDKTPRVFADDSAPEASASEWVEPDELEKLLEARSEFTARRVSKETAKSLLGWTV